MKTKKTPFETLLDNNRFLQILSIVIAVVCWLAVTVITSPTGEHTVSNVLVNLSNMQEDAVTDLGLNPIQDEETFASITLRGPRTVLGKIKPEDLNLTVRLSNVTDRGTYDLDLEVAPDSAIFEMENVEVKSIEPSTVRIRFDRLSTKTLEIEPLIKGLSTEPDYMVNQIRVSPTTVTVTAPQDDLDRIERAVINVDMNEPLRRPYGGDFAISLLDIQGDEISLESRHLVMDQDEAQLVIQVLRTATLYLEVGYTALPRGFPLEDLDNLMSLTHYAIRVAGPVDSAENYESMTLGYVDIRSLTPENNTLNFDVELPSGFINLDNVNNVLVQYNIQDWSTGNFYVGDVAMTNEPPQFDVSLLTSSLSNVVVVGDPTTLQELTSEDIVATVDLSERELSLGQYAYPVKISIPNKGLVWAVGEYSVVIQVSEKVVETLAGEDDLDEAV